MVASLDSREQKRVNHGMGILNHLQFPSRWLYLSPWLGQIPKGGVLALTLILVVSRVAAVGVGLEFGWLQEQRWE